MTRTPTYEDHTPTRFAIPGPDGYPLVGILPKMGRDALGFFVEMMHQYGDLVRLDFGSQQLLLVTHPEGVKYVLQDNNRNYTKGYDQVKPVLGEGLVTSDGEFWRRQRRLMQPNFHRRRIAAFASIMVETTAEMLNAWKPRSERGETLDLAQEMMRLTQQIIAKTMFSADVGGQTDILCNAFDLVLEYLNQRMFNPFRIFEVLPTPTNLRFRRALATLDEITYGLIDVRRASAQRPEDLLTMLIEAQDAETGESMTDEQIRDEVVTIFFAGHETTASTLSWTWYLLAQHPSVEHRLREEIGQVLGERAPTFADYPKLVYTRQVIDEALRFYPPAWMFARYSKLPDEVSGYHIPAETMLLLSPYVTHRHPDFWKNPERFDPDRFTPERAANRHKMAYFPFGGGPRLCIGKDFALVEASLILAMMAQNYRLNLVPGKRVTPQPIATLRPRPGISITLEPV